MTRYHAGNCGGDSVPLTWEARGDLGTRRELAVCIDGGGFCQRVARRGGNYNNTSNAGVAYLNCNNARSNTNTNNGARPRSRTTAKARYATRRRRHQDGRGAFPSIGK